MQKNSIQRSQYPGRAQAARLALGLCLVLALCAARTATAAQSPSANQALFAEQFDAKPGDTHEVSLGLGVSMSQSPYKGMGTSWMPFPIISYEGPYAYIRGMSAGVKFLNLEYFELSGFVSYNNTSYDRHASDDWQMRQLKDRYASIMGGMSARLTTPVGMLHLSGSGDLMGNSDGFAGTAGWIYSLEAGPVEFMPEAGVDWTTEKYTNYYYGVSTSEAERSGLKTYDAGAAFSPYLGLTVDWEINEHWDLFCKGQISFLGDEIRDSPMVDSKSTTQVSAGVVYNF